MSTTLGPWRFEAVSDACRVVLGTGRQKIILARLSTKQIPEKEVACNARLMAAAPDLLEAARYALTKGCTCHDTANPEWHSDRCIVPGLRAAIAKAEGRA